MTPPRRRPAPSLTARIGSRVLAVALTAVAAGLLAVPAALPAAPSAGAQAPGPGTVSPTGALGPVLEQAGPARVRSGASERRGPRLHTGRDRLRRAVHCTPQVTPQHPGRTVVLVHGTGSTGSESWGWSYRRALRADGFGVCVVNLPGRALGSFTRSAEYVVHAVRQAARRSGRDVALVGHSQGGSMSVWVTKFWPDVGRKVEDVVSIAGPLNGTELADNLCAPGRCTPLAWQSRTTARTLAALRGARLSPSTSYTSIVTLHDEIVYPQPRAGRMPGVKLVVAQDVCAADPVEHGLILGDPVTYAVALDALTHPGPGRGARVPTGTCRQSFIPHGDPQGSAVFLRTLGAFTTGLLDPRRMTGDEPRLPRYARAAARRHASS